MLWNLIFPKRKPKNKPIPKEVIKHIQLREGFRNKVYLDTLGNPTGGWGHLILKSDNMKVGDLIPLTLAEKWLEEDVRKAYEAALEQAAELGLSEDLKLVVVLTSVNYQLGVKWRSKFPNTWGCIKGKNYSQAIENLLNSAWFDQTPVRVRDLIKELDRLKGEENGRLSK